MELMTISEGARRLGYKSRSQLYRLINDCYLHEHVHVQQHTGQRLVDIEGLREKLQCICQWRPDSIFFAEPRPDQGLKSRLIVLMETPGLQPPYFHDFQSSSVGFNLSLSG